MTKKEYIKFARKTLHDMGKVIEAKNNDYCGTSSSPFFNAELSEQMGVISTEKAMFVRLSDKYARLAAFLGGTKLKVKEETVQDTLKDLIGYSVLMMGYFNANKKRIRKPKI